MRWLWLLLPFATMWLVAYVLHQIPDGEWWANPLRLTFGGIWIASFFVGIEMSPIGKVRR